MSRVKLQRVPHDSPYGSSSRVDSIAVVSYTTMKRKRKKKKKKEKKKKATRTSLCRNVSHIGRRRRKCWLAFSVSRYMQMRHMLSPRHIINYSCGDRRCIGGPKITYWSCQGHTRTNEPAEARPRPKRVTSYGARVRARATVHVWSSYGIIRASYAPLERNVKLSFRRGTGSLLFLLRILFLLLLLCPVSCPF